MTKVFAQFSQKQYDSFMGEMEEEAMPESYTHFIGEKVSVLMPYSGRMASALENAGAIWNFSQESVCVG